MTIQLQTTLASNITTNIADNTSGDISAADVRNILADLNDTLHSPFLSDGAANTVLRPFSLRRETSVAPSASIGVGLNFDVEITAGVVTMGYIDMVVSDVSATQDGYFSFTSYEAATYQEHFRIGTRGIQVASGSADPNIAILGSTTYGINLTTSVFEFTFNNNARYKFDTNIFTSYVDWDLYGHEIVLGDAGAHTRTQNSNKSCIIVGTHYAGPTQDEEVAIVEYKSQSGSSTVTIGGGNGSYNAATEVSIYAAANTTTLTGTQMLTVDTTEIFFNGPVTEFKTTASISTNTLTLDLHSSLVFQVSLNANITTFTINNVPASGRATVLTIIFTADGTARTITWPTAFTWPGGTAPTMTSTLNEEDIITAITYDGGTTWFAVASGQAFS